VFFLDVISPPLLEFGPQTAALEDYIINLP
jgi:hypothetical protein